MNDMSTIIELEADHQLWNNELNDMNDEISNYEQALGRKNNAYNYIEIEQFQNQFRVHKYAIQKIKNKIQKCQLHSDTIGGSCFTLVNEQEENYHQNIGKMVDRQLELYQKLILNFQQFINK